VIKWEKVEIETGLTSKAQENPLLASTLLLAKHNINFTYLSSVNTIAKQHKITLHKHTSLMIDEATLLEYPWLTEALLEWVASGGHLIYVLSPQRNALKIDENSQFLEHFSMKASTDDSLFYQPVSLLSKPIANVFMTTKTEKLSLYIPFKSFFTHCPGRGYNLSRYRPSPLAQNNDNPKKIANKTHNIKKTSTQPVNINAQQYQEATEVTLICDSPYQQGFITFLPSIHVLSTQSLKHLDHGAFLLWLIGKNNHLYYLPSFKSANWLVKLWQWSWLVMVLVVLIIISGLWHLATRFGSAITPLDDTKNLFADHIAAMGNFIYRQNYDEQLKKALLLDLELAIEKRNSHYKNLPESEQAHLLSQLTGKEVNTIKQLLSQEIPKQAIARIHYIQLFKALREAL
jgi:hypothetical protein